MKKVAYFLLGWTLLANTSFSYPESPLMEDDSHLAFILTVTKAKLIVMNNAIGSVIDFFIPPLDMESEKFTTTHKIIGAMSETAKDVVDYLSPPPGEKTSSEFPSDFCYHYPFSNACVTCLSENQAREKVNYLNANLADNGVKAFQYSMKIDWELRTVKIITLNLPYAVENTNVLSFNLCESSPMEMCDVPTRKRFPNAPEASSSQLDNLIIFSSLHVTQAEKTIALCKTQDNCGAELTTLSNGSWGLSMKVETKQALCEPFYHGSILERIGSTDPNDNLVGCLIEMPVCRLPEEPTKNLDAVSPVPESVKPVENERSMKPQKSTDVPLIITGTFRFHNLKALKS